MNGIGGDTKHDDGVAAAREEGIETPSGRPSSTNVAKVEDWATWTLHSLSKASTEAIGGIAVGLAACTYLVLGRLGLILIGVLGGIMLHATWEGQNVVTGSIDDVRREKGLDVVKRILDFRENTAKDQDDDPGSDIFGNTFDGFQPEVAAALNELVQAVMRDYVKWWYEPILPKDQSFPSAAQQTLTKFLLSVSAHLSKKRPVDTFLDFLTNSSAIVVVFLNELSSAFSVTQSTSLPAVEAINRYLVANPESSLANVLNTKQQAKKFKMIAGDILQNFLEKQTYECDTARIFLKEILAGVILEMTLKTCSKPEWINGWIVYLLEEGEPDISQAIDSGVGPGPNPANLFDVIDGNVGNVGLAKSQKSQVAKQEEKRHKKRLSKADEAMKEAMEEARRLSQLIAEEDAEKLRQEEIPLDQTPLLISAASDRTVQSQDPNMTGFYGTATTDQGSSQSLGLQDNQTAPAAKALGSPNRPPSTVPPPAPIPFTSFDQIVPQPHRLALDDEDPLPRRKTVSLTLHNANILIHDDSTSMDKGKIRSKPNGDYLVQIEPASSQHPGWMIVRRYSDFETLHEVLRRIAQVSGVTAFAEQHRSLPSWKDHTKASLRGELERYLRDACWYQPLAESEGMKRFLEKDQGQMPTTFQKSGFPGLGWPTPSAFENMSKGVLDVLTSAPKGVAEGGKVIGGGISGVFTNIGNLGQKKSNTGQNTVGLPSLGRSSTSTLPRLDSMTSMNGTKRGRQSEDSLRASPIVQTQPSKIPPMERRPSYNSIAEDEQHDHEPRASSEVSSLSGRKSINHSRDPSRTPSRRGTPLSSPVQGTVDDFRLPPLPSDIPDDYGSHFEDSSSALPRTQIGAPTIRTSTSTAGSQTSPSRLSLAATKTPSIPMTRVSSRKAQKEWTPLTEQETRIAVELLFAVISETYTLSSAWNIRRTLLIAAKTYLLRPGNPSLSSIQSLIQDSVIATNTSEAGITAHLRKLRENILPTEEEIKAWPQEMSVEDKERLRVKARRLLADRGVPAALTGVMGQAATSEAMQRIFDALQVEEVARGLVFGLLLQGVRAVTH
jgi:hypothetical protein